MASKTNILGKFDNIVVEHPHFHNAVEPVLTHVQLGSRGGILMVVGPTGVGKSTLIRYCIKTLDEYVLKYPECGMGYPLVIEAPAPERGEFNWKDFYIHALKGLCEPSPERKIDIDAAVDALIHGKSIASHKHMTTYKLREIFEQAIDIRRPIAIFIDEVQHLAKCKSQIRKADNLDVIKSISNGAATSYILVGTYEARDMMYHGGQLSRRVCIDHFHRYREDILDFRYFEHIFRSICIQFNLKVDEDVRNDIWYLYNHTLGCIGILMTWIRKTVELSITRGTKTLSRELFEKSRLSNIQLTAIAQEIAAFEHEHAQESDFDPMPFFCPSASEETSSPFVPDIIRRRGNHRPGVRKPMRDPVTPV